MNNVEIKILDLLKADNYTDRKRYVVMIGGSRQLSGDTEIEALTKTLAFIFKNMTHYQSKYSDLITLCAPLADYIKPDDN